MMTICANKATILTLCYWPLHAKVSVCYQPTQQADERSEVLKQGSILISIAWHQGRRFYFLSENNEVHKNLKKKGTCEQQGAYIGAEYHGHRYKKLNAVGSRHGAMQPTSNQHTRFR